MGISKGRERERDVDVPSRQEGKGTCRADQQRILDVFGRLQRARRGGGVSWGGQSAASRRGPLFPGRGSTRGRALRIYSEDL